MKKIILILISIFLSLSMFSENKMVKANQLYSSEKYEEAIEVYEQILKDGQESSALYYNLGNAYYKMNQMAPAILNYERCLLLNPGNRNAKFNLDLSRAKIVDKIDQVETFFLVSYFNSIVMIMSSNSWAWFSVITFILFLSTLLIYIFCGRALLRKISFYTSCSLVILSVLAFGFSKIQKDKILDKDYAIVFDDTVTVKGSPDESGTDLFLLHEGTKVKIKNNFGNHNEWSEIEIEDGNSGWVKSQTIEVI